MTDMKKRSTAVLTAAILATVLTIPATAIVKGDGVHQAHGRNALCQFFHGLGFGLPPSRIDFNIADFDTHGIPPQCENAAIIRLSISRSGPSSDSPSLRRNVISAEFSERRSRWNHSATLTPP